MIGLGAKRPRRPDHCTPRPTSPGITRSTFSSRSCSHRDGARLTITIPIRCAFAAPSIPSTMARYDEQGVRMLERLSKFLRARSVDCETFGTVFDIGSRDGL